LFLKTKAVLKDGQIVKETNSLRGGWPHDSLHVHIGENLDSRLVAESGWLENRYNQR
jgi:hypothetical protein